VIAPENLAAQFESLCIERLGFAEAARAMVQICEVVEAQQRVGMEIPQLVFLRVKCFLIEEFSLIKGAFALVKRCQVVEARQC